MEWLFARQTIVAVAIAGGMVSLAAMLLQKRPQRLKLARLLSITSYILMGASMLFFILAGLRGTNQ